ncbi:MAG: LPS export ABC transporter periplasmic protein LptC [Magnetococcus sp. DMHC-6]
MRHNLLKYFFLIFSLLIVISIVWYLWQFPLVSDGFEEEIPLGAEEGSLVTGIHLVQYDVLQHLLWTLNAPRAHRYKESVPGKLPTGENQGETIEGESAAMGGVLVYDPMLKINQKNGSQLSVMAHQGSVVEQTQELFFSGDVRVEELFEGTLNTEKLTFDAKKRILFTDQEFHFVGKRGHLQGVGMTFFEGQRRFEVNNQVKMVFPGGFGSLNR